MQYSAASVKPLPDLKRVANALIDMVVFKATFQTAVEQPFIHRDLTRADVVRILQWGLKEGHDDLKLTMRYFNVSDRQIRHVLEFLQRHGFLTPVATNLPQVDESH